MQAWPQAAGRLATRLRRERAMAQPLGIQPNQPGDRKSAGRKSVEENILHRAQNSEY